MRGMDASVTGAGTSALIRAGLWSAVRESILGFRHDVTEGNIDRAIILLAIPMVLEMCMESLFGVVDREASFIGAGGGTRGKRGRHLYAGSTTGGMGWQVGVYRG